MRVEQKAMGIAMKYERENGREPRDVSKDRREIGYDILSEERKIEVKGVGGRNLVK